MAIIECTARDGRKVQVDTSNEALEKIGITHLKSGDRFLESSSEACGVVKGVGDSLGCTMCNRKMVLWVEFDCDDGRICHYTQFEAKELKKIEE